MADIQPRPGDELLGMADIRRQFHDCMALDGVSLSVKRGEVCAVLGENGAGKTALMNIISGISRADGGRMWFMGVERDIQNPRQAFELGISIVTQEPEVVENLTLEQMIFLNRERTVGPLFRIDRAYQLERARATFDFMGWGVNPNVRVAALSPAERKLLLIARALCFECRLLILDDITANLESTDAAFMLDLIRRVNARGVTVIFITHKLEEALEMANHAVVLSNGRVIADFASVSEATASTLTRLMAGPDQRGRYPRTAAGKGRVLLSTDRLCSAEHHLRGINLFVREGEIVGVVNLQEDSKLALARLLCGAARPTSGRIRIGGRTCRSHTPAGFAVAGVAMLGASHADNLYPDSDAHFNVSAANLPGIGGRFVLRPRQTQAYASSKLRAFNMSSLAAYRPVATYSYGTQQKLALLRSFCAERRVVIMVDPTAGIDGAAKVDAYNLMNHIVRQGRAIMLFSSDMQEIAGMADRIYVLYGGAVVAELSSREATPSVLLDYATGKRGAAAQTDRRASVEW